MQVASYIRRFLILKLLLEHEIIEYEYNLIFDNLQKYYPKEYEELNLPSEIKNALIVYQGELTADYKYLEKYLSAE